VASLFWGIFYDVSKFLAAGAFSWDVHLLGIAGGRWRPSWALSLHSTRRNACIQGRIREGSQHGQDGLVVCWAPREELEL
jgi:hypothetical protein